MNRAILFDYNGVIADDETLQEEAIRNTLQLFGFVLTPSLYIEYCLGKRDEDGFRSLMKAFPRAFGNVRLEDIMGNKYAAYQELVKGKSVAYPGIYSIIKNLAAHWPLAIVTGSLAGEALPVLNQENLRPFFRLVLTAEDVTRGKPHPEGYQKAIERLSVPPDQTIVVEDSPSGVTAAKAADAKCIAVLHTCAPNDLQHADRLIPSIHDLTATLAHELFESP